VTNVLITGGAGFIGSHLTERLLARGDRVLVIDNFSTARRDSLPPAHQGLELVEGTIADEALVEDCFARSEPEVVVHAAASYKDPDAWPEDCRTNAVGSAVIAQAAQRHSVGRLIYFQTALCYGLQPLEQPITLSHPLLPGDSSYAISKTAGEHYVRLSGLDYVSFRLANMYGPRNLSGPLPTFFHRLGAGKGCFVMDTRRDFIYVDDLLELVVRAIDGTGASGVYHASSGGDYSIQELFDATTAAMGLQLDEPVEVRPRNPDDAFTILLDPSETKAQFDGWQTSTPLVEGVAATVAWYQSHGIEQTYTHLRGVEGDH
jgi:UDP-glucose 4-epimerase